MAINTNIVVLCGRLTRDPEQRFTPTGKSVANFGIAVNSSFNGKENVGFFDIEAWNGTGDAVVKHQRKGNRVLVHGELRHSRWTDNSGNRRSKVLVRATRVEFFDWADRTGQATGEADDSAAQPTDTDDAVPEVDPTDEEF